MAKKFFCPESGAYFRKNGRLYVRYFSENGIRDMLVPEPGTRSVKIFTQSHFKKILEDTKIVTKEMKEQQEIDFKRNFTRLAQESAKRKAELQKNAPAKKSEVPVEYLIEKEKESKYILKRAKELIQDENPEVRDCKRALLGAQCQAIREAQIAEKAVIQNELMLQAKARDALNVQKIKDDAERATRLAQEDKARKKEYITNLMVQIKAHERLNDLRKGELIEEAKRGNDAMRVRQLQDMNDFKEKAKKQAQLRNLMMDVNTKLQLFQSVEREEQRLGAQKMADFLKFKENRQKAFNDKVNKRRASRAALTQRMFDRQNEALQQEEAKQAMEEMRIKDEMAKKWRLQEMEAGQKKQEAIEALKQARLEQLLNIKSVKAVEIERTKEEFFKIANVNKKEMKKQEIVDMKRTIDQDNQRTELLKQINDKERLKTRKRKETYEEGLALRLEENLRKENVKEAIARKIQEARDKKMPEKYVLSVECQFSKI